MEFEQDYEHLRESLTAQRVENWLSEMRRNPNTFMRGGYSGRSLLWSVADSTFGSMTEKDQEAMILAAAAGDAVQLLEIVERRMRDVVEALATADDQADVCDEYAAEQAEYERDRWIDQQIEAAREAA